VGGHVDSGQGQHACVITLLQLLPQLLPPFAKPLHVRRLRGPSPASPQVTGPTTWRRMGDSNPRGLAPNTLSNCVFRCSWASAGVYLCRSAPVGRQGPTAIDAHEHEGTATETATVACHSPGRGRVDLRTTVEGAVGGPFCQWRNLGSDPLHLRLTPAPARTSAPTTRRQSIPKVACRLPGRDSHCATSSGISGR